MATVRIGDTSAWAVSPALLRIGSNILSGGAGKDISFEIELAQKHGCVVALFDPSPTGENTYRSVPAAVAGLKFFQLGLSAVTETVSFALPANSEEGSYASPAPGEAAVEFPCVSPQAAMDMARFISLDLLKLDIEGFEYEFLRALIDAQIRPSQIAVEFHHFLPSISIWRTVQCVRMLHRAGYRMVRKARHDYLFVRNDLIDLCRQC